MKIRTVVIQSDNKSKTIGAIHNLYDLLLSYKHPVTSINLPSCIPIHELNNNVYFTRNTKIYLP